MGEHPERGDSGDVSKHGSHSGDQGGRPSLRGATKALVNKAEGASSGFWTGIIEVAKPLLQDMFLSIRLPQELIVTNPRLCLLHKVIQLSTLLALAAYFYIFEIWTVTETPVPYSFSTWPQAMSAATLEEGTLKRHCTQPTSYQYTYYGTATYEYSPRACKALDLGDAWIKKSDQTILFSYISEYEFFRSANRSGECLNRKLCTAGNGTLQVRPGEGCECHRASDYFVKNIEGTTIHFVHGYQVPRPDNRVERSSVQESAEGPDMLTLFVKPDGSPCEVRGKTQLTRADIGPDGIWASVEDWMKCAGTYMDAAPKDFGLSDPSLTVLRMMGFRLLLTLKYENTRDWDMVYCYVYPTVTPIWSSAYQSTSAYDDFSMGKDSMYVKSRLAQGIVVDFEVTGEMKFFAWNALITGCVNMMFLASVPRMIIQFLCVYCIGSLSHIYRNAKRTKFSIQNQMKTAIARALMPMMIFRGLTGGDFQKKAKSLPALTALELKDHVKDLFIEGCHSHLVEDKHINRMVMMLCGGTNLHHKEYTETIDYKAFEKLCNANDVISSEVMVTMMHWKRQKWFLERLLDDTDTSLDARVFASLVQKKDKKSENVETSDYLSMIVQDTKNEEAEGDQVQRLLQEVSSMEERVDRAIKAIQQADEHLDLARVKADAACQRAELAEMLVRNQEREIQGRKGEAKKQEEDMPETMQTTVLSMTSRVQQIDKTSRQAIESATTTSARMTGLCKSVEELNKRIEEQKARAKG